MKKQLGILLLVLLATVGTSGAVAAAPPMQGHMQGPMQGHMVGHMHGPMIGHMHGPMIGFMHCHFMWIHHHLFRCCWIYHHWVCHFIR